MSSSERDDSSTVDSESVPQGVVIPHDKFWKASLPEREGDVFRQYIGEGRGKPQVFTPENIHCGAWHDSPNKEQHASFGDQGTTASASCYGEILQMSQFLGVGRSGVFAMNHEDTEEPYNVRQRAEDLHGYCRSPSDGLTFGVLRSLDPYEVPVTCRWVNWRWPRFDFNPLGSQGVEASYQYMVHDGVVLQQFVVDNTKGQETFEFVCGFLSGHKIQDLDFVDHPHSFNDTDENYWHTSGPHGYGLVSLNPMDKTSDDTNTFKHMPHGVASVITVFVDGRAVEMGAGRTSHHSEWRKVGARETFQLVVAYKLLSISNLAGMSWKDFIVSAEEADINRLLKEETKKFNTGSTICDLGLTLFSAKEVENILTAGSESSGTTGTTAQQHQTKSHGSITPPNSIPAGPEADLKPYLEYLAWRHLEYILSACAVPFCVRKKAGLPDFLFPFTDKQDGGRKEELKYQDLPFVALTCGDMSGHRVVTSTSYFAFVFLIRISRRLKACQKQLKEEVPYISDLQKRISTVCRGHMRWLQRVRMIDQSEKGSEHTSIAFKAGSEEETPSSRLLYSGCFAANYWVTGEMIPRRGETWQPPNMITDTAFQSLKMTEIYNHLGQFDKTLDTENKHDATTNENAEDRHEILKMIEDTYVPWFSRLGGIDHQENFAWPHTVTEGFNKFRFDDHFWIWKALKSLERSKVTSRHLQASKSRLSKDGKDDPGHTGWNEIEEKWMAFLAPGCEGEKFKLTLERLKASNVQRRVLQRFTTENNV